MNPAILPKLSVQQLVEQFITLGLQQAEAREAENINKYNKLFMDMKRVVDELKSRPGDQRHALLPLYRHENIQVRLRAAKITFALAPDEARRVLELLYASKRYPYAADAGGMLLAIDEGSYQPE